MASTPESDAAPCANRKRLNSGECTHLGGRFYKSDAPHLMRRTSTRRQMLCGKGHDVGHHSGIQLRRMNPVLCDHTVGYKSEMDPRWLLVEEGFTLAREHEIESLFSIGNGATGIRGSLEEGSELSSPATFVAGIFVHPEEPGAVPELLTFPNWTNLNIWINGSALSMTGGGSTRTPPYSRS